MGSHPHAEFTTAPYPGLRPFESEEQDIFFGREKQTDQLLEKLEKTRFLAVVGPSGCGKSSLVRAGLLPALETGFMAAAGTCWTVASMRPGDAPFHRLATTVVETGIAGGARRDAAFVKAGLRRGPLGLVEAVRESGVCAGTNVLLLVDQFEELFRYGTEAARDEADAFVAMLLASAAQRELPIFIAITMRSDYLGDCATFPGLAEAVSNSQYLTPRLSRDECALAIRGPARVFGGEIDGALAERLLNDFGPDPDQLPVLQHALMRMWTRRKAAAPGSGGKIVLTLDDYKEVGGLALALSKHANEALEELSGERKHLATILFKRLSHRTPGKPDTRAPARVEQIAAIAEVDIAEIVAVADAFRRSDRCLLTPGEREPLSGDSILDVSHESLLRCWDKLHGWIDEEAEWASTYRRLKEAAALWRAGKAAPWSSPDLEGALAWRTKARPNAAWAARYGTEGELALALQFLEESERRQKAAEEAEQRERERREAKRERELRRVRRFAWGAGAIAAFMNVLALGYYLGFVRETSSYFEDISERFGAPSGLGSLSAAQVRHRPSSLKVARKGWFGRVVRIEAVNAKQQPTTVHKLLNPFGIDGTRESTDVSWEYSYDDDDRVEMVLAFDARHRRLWGFRYSRDPGVSERATLYALPSELASGAVPSANDVIAPARSGEGHGEIPGAPGAASASGGLIGKAIFIVVTYGSDGREVERRYQDAIGHPKRGLDHAFGKASKFDDAGHLISFMSIDPQGHPMNDDDGNATMVAAYDGDLVVEERSFDREGQPTMAFDGWHISKFRYDAYGNITGESYFDTKGEKVANKNGYHSATHTRDDQGNETYMAFANAAGEPARDVNGCNGYAFAYDSRGRLQSTTCVDVHRAPILDNAGCASTVISYDERERATEWKRLGPDGHACADKSGVAVRSRRYEGNVTLFSLAGTDGAPVLEDGYAVARESYDASGNCIRVEYLGVDGRPVLSSSGFSHFEWSYDEFGNKLEESYYGIDGKRALDKSGIAGWRARYDTSGNKIEVANYGLQLEHVLEDGYAGWRAEYDESGNRTRLSYFDATEAPTYSSDRVAGWRSSFDRDREVRRDYFDANDKPATNVHGVAGWQAQYDARGKCIRLDYLSARGSAALYRWAGAAEGQGYASEVMAYDAKGVLVEVSYFGLHGERVVGEKGFARALHQIDERGRMTESRYFGADNEPMSIPGGYHRVERRYDEYGNPVDIAFFAPSGQPATTKEGYARLLKRYDDRGRLVDQFGFHADGSPARMPGGCHHSVNELDQYGRVVAERCQRDDGSAETSEDGWSVMRHSYNDHGKVVEDRYERPEGSLALTRGGYAIARYEYDAFGRNTTMSFLDSTRKPVVAKAGYASVRGTYNGRGLLTSMEFFDANSRLRIVPGVGYARVLYEYDNRGSQSAESYFGADGKPIVVPLGYARVVIEVNERGEAAAWTYFGADRRRIMLSKGYSALRKKFDEAGRQIDISTYDTEDHLVVNAYGYARMKKVYDENGNLVEERYFGTDGKRLASTRWTYDAAGAQIKKELFDAAGSRIAVSRK